MFPLPLRTEETWVHTVMVMLLTVIIASILFAIYTLEHRFSADTQLTPEALELDLQQSEESP